MTSEAVATPGELGFQQKLVDLCSACERSIRIATLQQYTARPTKGVDSLVFYPIAFYGIWDNAVLFGVLLFNFLFKVSVEVVMTPATYWCVGFLKRAEDVDTFDTETNFTPFSISDR